MPLGDYKTNNPALREQLGQMTQAGLMAMGNPRMNYGQALGQLQEQKAQEDYRNAVIEQQKREHNRLIAQQKAVAEASRLKRIETARHNRAGEAAAFANAGVAGVSATASALNAQTNASKAAADNLKLQETVRHNKALEAASFANAGATGVSAQASALNAETNKKKAERTATYDTRRDEVLQDIAESDEPLTPAQIATKYIGSGVEDLMERGFEIREGLAGDWEVEIDEDRGVAIRHNAKTGVIETSSFRKNPDTGNIEKAWNGLTIYDLLGDASGVSATLRKIGGGGADLVNQALGTTIPTGQVTRQATQQIISNLQSIVRSLQKSPRYAEGERKWIIEEILNISPSLIFSGEYKRDQLAGLVGYMYQDFKDTSLDVSNNQLSEADRTTAERSRLGLQRAMRDLGSPVNVASESEANMLLPGTKIMLNGKIGTVR